MVIIIQRNRMNENAKIFDRKRLRYHRDRAVKDFATYDFLVHEAAERLAERLEDTSREFQVVLDLGCHTGQLQETLGKRGNIQTLIQCDLSENMVKATKGICLVADEEALPFAPESFDLVMSVMSLHWVNDLPGTLAQIRRILKPDGVLLVSFLGGSTLTELRQSVLHAAESQSGVSPRVSPFVDVKDAGALLQRAGFSMPVADCDTVTVTYPNAFLLMKELRGMGESNILLRSQKHLTHPQMLAAIAESYHELFMNDEQEIPATFDIITATGMRPNK